MRTSAAPSVVTVPESPGLASSRICGSVVPIHCAAAAIVTTASPVRPSPSSRIFPSRVFCPSFSRENPSAGAVTDSFSRSKTSFSRRLSSPYNVTASSSVCSFRTRRSSSFPRSYSNAKTCPARRLRTVSLGVPILYCTASSSRASSRFCPAAFSAARSSTTPCLTTAKPPDPISSTRSASKSFGSVSSISSGGQENALVR